MLKSNLLFLLLLVAGIASGQEIDRTMIKGKLTAPPGEDVEGISIYNRSSQEGTVSQADGTFELKMAENDRVLFTALQFQAFTVIIDKGVIDSESLSIYLNPNVNLLEEVIVRPYDLTGNVSVDVNRVKVYDFDSRLSLDYTTVEYNYSFQDDAQTRVREVISEEASNLNLVQYGFNPLGILDFIGGKKKKSKDRTLAKLQRDEGVATVLRQRYNVYYFKESFNIPEARYDDFIYFVQEQGVPEGFLEPQNEILLLTFLKQESIIYLERAADSED